MNRLPEIFLVMAVAILATIFLSPNGKGVLTPRHSQQDLQTENLLARMGRDANRDVASEIYTRKVVAAHHYDLINAVAYTCLDKYRRDDCIVNLIKCGPSCKTLIPRDRFSKIEADYWVMIDERHLRDKVRIQR